MALVIGGGGSSAAAVVPRPTRGDWRPGRTWMTDFSSADQDNGVWDFINAVRTTDSATNALQQTVTNTYMAALTKEPLRNVDVRMRFRTPACNVNVAIHLLARYLGTFRSSQQTVTITGTPSGGTFTLTYNGSTTSAIAFNATAATVQAALEALPSIGAGNVVCTGGAFPGTAVVCTFQGSFEGQSVPKLTADITLLTGGTPALAVTTALTPTNQAIAGDQWQASLSLNSAAPGMTVNSYSGANLATLSTASAGRDAGSTTPVRNLRLQLVEDLARIKSWIETAQTSVYTVTLGGSPTGGTFTLTYGGQTTSGIAFNATNTTVQTAFQALSSVGSGNATVTGSAGGPWTITFAGTLASTETTALTGSAASLTGGVPTITLAQTTYGATGKEPDWQYSARLRTSDAARSNVDIGRAGFGVRAASAGSNPYIYSLRVTELLRHTDNLLLNSDYAISDSANPTGPAFWNPLQAGISVVTTEAVPDRFGNTRTALKVARATGNGDNADWQQDIWVASKGGPNGFVARPRPYYYSCNDFPSVLEISVWSKGTAVTTGALLGGSCVLYYYDKDANILNGGDPYYYHALGPSATDVPASTGGTGTWDWYETRWRAPIVNSERVVKAILHLTLHDATGTGTLYFGDVVVRPVA